VLDDVRRLRLPLPERGVEIALLDWGGEGPLALLHHANGFCAATWDLVARGLTPHFRVVAMDGRGHGDSSAPEGQEAYAWREFGADVAAVAHRLADELALPLALGLGNSFGGTSFLLAEAAEPGLFERLVLVDPVLVPAPAASPGGASPVPGNARKLVEATAQRSAVFPDRATARAGWADKPLFAGWRPRALDLYVAEGLADRPDGQVELKCAPRVEAAVFANGAGSGIWDCPERVKPPTRLLWSRRGDFPLALFERYAARMPQAELVDFDAGHLAPMESPEQVVDAVIEFAGPGRRPAARTSTG